MSRYPKHKFPVNPETGEVVVPRWAQRLDENGAEVLDTTPLAIPVGFERPPTLEAQIERIMSLSARRAALAGEDLDEDDFDDEEDDLPETRHQTDADMRDITLAAAKEAREAAKILRRKPLTKNEPDPRPDPKESKGEGSGDPDPQ